MNSFTKMLIIVSVGMILMIPMCLTPVQASSEVRNEVPMLTNIQMDVPVVVLGNDYDQSLEQTVQNDVLHVDNVSSITERSLVLVDTNWFVNNSNSNEEIRDLIDYGSIVTTLSSYVFTNENSVLPVRAFSQDADFYAMYYDYSNGRYVCYSSSSSSADTSIVRAMNWIDQRLNSETGPVELKPPRIQSTEISDWGDELEYFSDKALDNYGWMNVRTIYFQLQENNPDSNYYQAHYLLQGVPNNKRAIADMYNSNTLQNENAHLIRYGPTSTSGTSSASVDLSFGLDGINISCSWDYAIPDVVVKDHSNLAFNKFDISHDVNERGNVGMNTYYVEPGIIVKVDCNGGDGSYNETDNYSIRFCDHKIFTIFEFGTVSDSIDVYIEGS